MRRQPRENRNLHAVTERTACGRDYATASDRWVACPPPPGTIYTGFVLPRCGTSISQTGERQLRKTVVAIARTSSPNRANRSALQEVESFTHASEFFPFTANRGGPGPSGEKATSRSKVHWHKKCYSLVAKLRDEVANKAVCICSFGP